MKLIYVHINLVNWDSIFERKAQYDKAATEAQYDEAMGEDPIGPIMIGL